MEKNTKTKILRQRYWNKNTKIKISKQRHQDKDPTERDAYIKEYEFWV